MTATSTLTQLLDYEMISAVRRTEADSVTGTDGLSLVSVSC